MINTYVENLEAILDTCDVARENSFFTVDKDLHDSMQSNEFSERYYAKKYLAYDIYS